MPERQFRQDVRKELTQLRQQIKRLQEKERGLELYLGDGSLPSFPTEGEQPPKARRYTRKMRQYTAPVSSPG
jgi:hypothetical protein